MEAFDSDNITGDMNIKRPPAMLKGSTGYPDRWAIDLQGAICDLSQVQYGSVNLVPGVTLTPTQVKDPPAVSWEVEDDSFYALVMNDPDAPSRTDPKFREWQHWCVVNIPGSDVSRGEVLSQYVGSGPRKGTNLHRYVFLLFKQNGKLTFEETPLTIRSGEGRRQHHVSKFAEKYGLGNPVAGNYFQAEWDDYVPKLHEQLFGK